MTNLREPVTLLLRHVAATKILPRFRHLAAGDIEEKTPGELVTVADREAETALANGLSHLLPEARVVGEEACSRDPSQLDGLDRGLLWIVDPIDGTANFAAGREPFGVIVALARDGVTREAWILDPVSGRLCHAVQNGGASIDGAPVRVPAADPVKPVAALATQFMTPRLRATMLERAALHFEVVPIPRCAAEHYPRLALGQNHIALFQRTLPWDHAAGALFLTESGGTIARWDGTPYAFHDDRRGLLAATSEGLWRYAAAHLAAGVSSSDDAIIPQRLDDAVPGAR